MKKERLSLPVQILIALVFGIAVGLICYFTDNVDFTTNYLKPIGTIFINLLKFIVVPVVLVSMISGIISMGDLKKVGSVGWKTVLYFLTTTALACVIGLIIASLFNSANLFPVLMPEESPVWEESTSVNFMDTLVNIFPTNMWESFSNANMLQVIVISLLIGSGILAAGQRGELVTNLVNSFYAVLEKVMGFIISLSPIGVFTMIAWIIATQGIKILGPIAMVLLAAYLGYIFHAIGVYSLSVGLFAKLNPVAFFKGAAAAMILGFSSASSLAALPVSKECADKMGAEEQISAFVLPLGATINMDGTAVYQSVATIFLAACCGIDLTLGQMALVVVTATLASIGTAGVSGAGIIMLSMVLEAVNVPTEMIMIIYGVDRLFDMGRTCLNVTGDIACCLCVTSWERRKSFSVHKKE